MKEITVQKIPHSGNVSISEVRELLEAHAPSHSVDVVNWPEFAYRPEVKFRIGHTGHTIWLTFYVTENHILARFTEPNTSTHKDSCVEFFLDPKKDGNYYNFEFNAIGTTHLAYGGSIRERNFIDPDLISSPILTLSSLGNEPVNREGDDLNWELTVVIPADILIHEETENLSGQSVNANFFKCGDETYTPHFLSWNPVGTDRPSFHQPGYFGRLVFE